MANDNVEGIRNFIGVVIYNAAADIDSMSGSSRMTSTSTDDSRPPSTQLRKSARLSSSQAEPVNYNVRYHPMNDILWPGRAKKRLREHGNSVKNESSIVAYQDESSEPEDGDKAGSGDDDFDEPEVSKQGDVSSFKQIRSSSRITCHSSQIYNEQVHPQDEQLYQAGVVIDQSSRSLRVDRRAPEQSPDPKRRKSEGDGEKNKPSHTLNNKKSKTAMLASTNLKDIEDFATHYINTWKVFGKTEEELRHETMLEKYVNAWEHFGQQMTQAGVVAAGTLPTQQSPLIQSLPASPASQASTIVDAANSNLPDEVHRYTTHQSPAPRIIKGLVSPARPPRSGRSKRKTNNDFEIYEDAVEAIQPAASITDPSRLLNGGSSTRISNTEVDATSVFGFGTETDDYIAISRSWHLEEGQPLGVQHSTGGLVSMGQSNYQEDSTIVRAIPSSMNSDNEDEENQFSTPPREESPEF